MKKLICLVVILSISSAFAGKKPGKKKEILPKVYVQKMQKKKMSESASYMGKLEPAKVIRIYSPVEGIITKMKIKAGQKVKKGQILAEIQQNVIGLQVLPVKIRSSIDGHIYQPLFLENSLVNKNHQLFTIFDPTVYKLVINLTPEDTHYINLGQSMKIEIGKKNSDGIVAAIAPDIDILTGTRAVEIQIKNSESLDLRPGMIVQAGFNYNERDAYLLDKKVVKRKGDKYYLRVLDDKKEISEVEVTLGSSIKDKVEILSKDLKDGNQVVIKSSMEPLMKKQKVEIVADKKTETKEEVKKIKI